MNEIKILIVEDNEDIMEFSRDFLTKKEMIVDTATTKKEAIQKVRKNKYHIVLID